MLQLWTSIPGTHLSVLPGEAHYSVALLIPSFAKMHFSKTSCHSIAAYLISKGDRQGRFDPPLQLF
jgi:hypothetical protein